MARLFMIVGIMVIVISSFFPLVFLSAYPGSEDALLASFCHDDEVPVISRPKGEITLASWSSVPIGSYHCKHSEKGLRDISVDIEESIFGKFIHLSSQVGISIVCSVLGSFIGLVLLILGILFRVIARANPDVVYKRAGVVEGQSNTRSAQLQGGQAISSHQTPAQGSIKVPGIFGGISKLFGLNISEESIKQLQELQQLQIDGELTDDEAKKRAKEILFTRK